MPAQPEEQANWEATIARSLALLCLHHVAPEAADQPTKAAFLVKLGIPREEVAEMLGVPAGDVRKLLYKAKKAGSHRKSPR